MSQINSKLYVIRDVFQGEDDKSCWHATRSTHDSSRCEHPDWWALPLQPVMKSEAPPVDLTALWLIPMSSPCPAPAVPKMSRHLTHPLSLSLSLSPSHLTTMIHDYSPGAALQSESVPFAAFINDPEWSCFDKLVVHHWQEWLVVLMPLNQTACAVGCDHIFPHTFG